MVMMSKRVSFIFALFLFRLSEGTNAVPIDYARRVCKSFAQLGVHSRYIVLAPLVSFLFSTRCTRNFSTVQLGGWWCWRW